MSPKLQPVRGTHDLLPEDHRKFRHIVDAARGQAELFGYAQMDTPIFENKDVFHRTLGDTSDVVTKETYTFTDRGGEELTLRPELTAAIARAFLSNSLKDHLPLKWFYAGPAFRYERPQKGRFRQFHQIGIETLGIEHSLAHVEAIELAQGLLAKLGLKNVVLEINTLGDDESRNTYRQALIQYFTMHQAALSEDSKMRLERNPLRILDSKDEGDRTLINGAPKLQDYLTESAKKVYEEVKAGLSARGIAFKENDRLVRGLDYYNHVVFEFVTDALGAQNTVIAGGRYDKLIETMGGEKTAGVGWAAGVERLMTIVDFAALSDFVGRPAPIGLVPMSDDLNARPLVDAAHALRGAGHAVEFLYKGNMGKRMKRADKLGAPAVVIFGEDEMSRGAVTVKELATGEQREVKLADLSAQLAKFLR